MSMEAAFRRAGKNSQSARSGFGWGKLRSAAVLLLAAQLLAALMFAAPLPRRLVPLAAAHEGHEGDGEHQHPPAAKVPDDVVHRPTAVPDRIVLTWTQDPARTQAVTWRTDASVTRALAQLAVSDGGPRFLLEVADWPAKTSALATDLGTAHYHCVEFRDLTPDTKYVYRVGDGENWSEWIRFRTASDKPAPFSFVYFGDAQNEIRSHWSRVVREAFTDAPKAAFLLHAGDLINNANSDAQWGEWFGAGGWLNAMIPSLPTPGNHEYFQEEVNGEKKRRLLTPHWRQQFTLPENGPAGLEETAYYIDYQGVRIVSLNSNERQAEQAAWLDGVLASNPHRWTIVAHHHPIYSAAKDRDNPELRKTWAPVYHKHRVDLVLQGHDHTYGRSGLLTQANFAEGVRLQEAETGVVYVVSVSGPKLYLMTPEKRRFFSRVAEGLQLYQVISVDGDELRYQARTAAGELYDAFTLKKRPGQNNELVEQIPDTPVRLFNESPPQPANGGK